MPKVVAHRGDSHTYPENTLPAFTSARDMGVDVIETDVHLTKDAEVVIWHDSTLDRNTDGAGRIEDYTLAELRTFDAGYTFTKDEGRSFPFRGKGIRMITLDEALQSCATQRFNVDLKSKDTRIVDAFTRVIRRNNAERRVLCASFHLSHLKRIRKESPEILTSVTTAEVLPLLIQQKLNLLPRSFGPDRTLVFQVPVAQWGIKVITPRFIEEFHKRNAVIMVWTINEEEDMENLFDMGVDTIMSDNAELLISVARRKDLM